MKVGRLAEISRVFLEEGLALSNSGAPDPAERASLPRTDAEKGRRLRRALSRLGPTFVKFGQLLATRLDLFSPPFLRELERLRSNVPPFPSEQAREIIEAELGEPVDALFSAFPDAPVASASVAQVYRLRLFDSGQTVAVKVIRPGLRETLERDLDIIIDISKTLDRLLPVYRRSMVHQVAVEYAERARRESELLLEAYAMSQFEAVTDSVPEFVVPKVYFELCTRNVLSMAWLDGTLLDTVKQKRDLKALGVEPDTLARSLLRLQLVMSYEHGFVHGDTHPGNLFLLKGGRFGLIDFGLHGHVPRKLCDQMLELLFYQTSGRTSDAVRSFGQIFGAHRIADRQGFEGELAKILEADPRQSGGNPLTSQLVEGLRLGAEYQLEAQSELLLVLRNLTIVEGIVLTFCPEFDVLEEAAEILRHIIRRRARQGFLDPSVRDMAPLLLLNMAKRPELLHTLARLERSFADATDLGEFLERERVFERCAPAPRTSPVVPVLIGVLSALVTAFVLFFSTL